MVDSAFGSESGGRRRLPWSWVAVSVAAVVALVVGVVVVVNRPKPEPPGPPLPGQTCQPEGKSGNEAQQKWPCTPQEKASQAARFAADHQAAADASRLGAAEALRLYGSGATKATPVLERYYAGEVLANVVKGMQIYHTTGYRVVGSTRVIRVVYRTPYPGTEDGATQVVTECIDYNAVRIVDAKTGRDPTPMFPDKAPRVNDTTLTKIDDVWKVTSATKLRAVKSCAGL